MLVIHGKNVKVSLFFLSIPVKRKRLEFILSNSKRKHALNIGSGILTLGIDKLPKKMLKQNKIVKDFLV